MRTITITLKSIRDFPTHSQIKLFFHYHPEMKEFMDRCSLRFTRFDPDGIQIISTTNSYLSDRNAFKDEPYIMLLGQYDVLHNSPQQVHTDNQLMALANCINQTILRMEDDVRLKLHSINQDNFLNDETKFLFENFQQYNTL